MGKQARVTRPSHEAQMEHAMQKDQKQEQCHSTSNIGLSFKKHLPYKTESLGEHEAMGTSDMGIGKRKLAQAMNYAMMRAKKGMIKL